MKLRLQNGLDRGKHQREVLRPASGHDGIGRDFLDCNSAFHRLHDAEHRMRIERRMRKHAIHQVLRGRDDGQPVGPATILEGVLGRGKARWQAMPARASAWGRNAHRPGPVRP